MHALTKPKYFMPIHGEQRHLITHKRLAEEMGMPENHIFVSEIGKVLELDRDGARFSGSVPSGKILVDGYGVGDVGNIVLRDRDISRRTDSLSLWLQLTLMKDDNLRTGHRVARICLCTRIRAADGSGAADRARRLVECLDRNITDWTELKGHVKDDLSKFLYSKTKRKPMILPVVMNV